MDAYKMFKGIQKMKNKINLYYNIIVPYVFLFLYILMLDEYTLRIHVMLLNIFVPRACGVKEIVKQLYQFIADNKIAIKVHHIEKLSHIIHMRTLSYNYLFVDKHG